MCSAIWFRALLAGLLCAQSGCDAGGNEGQASAIADSANDRAADCQPEDCRHLSGPCSRGKCDGAKRACVVVAANDGDLCLPDSPCGESRCDRGACVPTSPPDCSHLDDTCQVGECSHDEGCVAAAIAVPGIDCQLAPTTNLEQRIVKLSVDATCGSPSPLVVQSVGAAGKAAYFELDLTGQQQAKEVAVQVFGEREVKALLARGECNDLAPISSGEAVAWLGESPGVEFRERLAPASYRVVVAGADGSPGEVTLRAALLENLTPSTQDGHPCDNPRPIELSGGRTVLFDVFKRSDERDLACNNGVGTTSGACYSLDLTSLEHDAWLQLATPRGAFAVYSAPLECSQPLVAGITGSSLLPPSRYLLSLEEFGESFVSTLVNVQDPNDCDKNVSCSSAIELDPAQDLHFIAGDTACAGRAALETPVGAALFYRLDLRSAEGVTRLSWDAVGSRVLLLAGPEDADCTTYADVCVPCDLEPKVHLLAINNDPPQPFEGLLSLQPL